MTGTRLATMVCVLTVVATAGAFAAQGGHPRTEEAAALAALKGQVSGRIVWELSLIHI